MEGHGRYDARYGREMSAGWTGGGIYPGAGYRRDRYFGGPRRYERGLEIGPSWAGGSDIGYGVHRVGHRGYDRGLRSRRAYRAGAPGPGRSVTRRERPLGYDWRYW